MRPLLILCVSAVAWLQSACGVAQLRVVQYNTTGLSNPAAMQTILQAIGNESINDVVRPLDVLILQEQDSVAGNTQDIVEILNGLYGAGMYDRGTVNGDTQGSGRPGLIFNTQTIELLGEQQIGMTSTGGAARAPMRYELRPIGYGETADFYVYASHYVSDSATRRLVEAQSIRTDADALGQGAHIIYAGDFNITSSNVGMYQHLLSAGNGQAFDPIASPGVWRDSEDFKAIHTQNPAGTGFVGGGMDDRFDFQLVTGEFLDGVGLEYMSGSYLAFGNNGSHMLNGHINTGTGALMAVLDALGQASDHLPVIAQYHVLSTILLGDFTRDGQLAPDDVPAMLSALTNLEAYRSENALSVADLLLLGDFDGDDAVGNADIQLLLQVIGGGQSVPEPGTLALGLIGALILVSRRLRPGALCGD